MKAVSNYYIYLHRFERYKIILIYLKNIVVSSQFHYYLVVDL